MQIKAEFYTPKGGNDFQKGPSSQKGPWIRNFNKLKCPSKTLKESSLSVNKNYYYLCSYLQVTEYRITKFGM